MTTKADVHHPAKYSASIAEWMQLDLRLRTSKEAEAGRREFPVLDVFGGIGRIHQIAAGASALHAHEDGAVEFPSTDIEIEAEWATAGLGVGWIDCGHDGSKRHLQHSEGHRAWRIHGDSADAVKLLGLGTQWAVYCSPPYANRLGDDPDFTWEQQSDRHTYSHALSRPLSAGSAARSSTLDSAYMQTCGQIITAVHDVLEPDGWFVVNVSDSIRDEGRTRIRAEQWWVQEVMTRGFVLESAHPLKTPRNGHGAGGHLRLEREMIFVFRRLDVDPVMF